MSTRWCGWASTTRAVSRPTRRRRTSPGPSTRPAPCTGRRTRWAPTRLAACWRSSSPAVSPPRRFPVRAAWMPHAPHKPRRRLLPRPRLRSPLCRRNPYGSRGRPLGASGRPGRPPRLLRRQKPPPRLLLRLRLIRRRRPAGRSKAGCGSSGRLRRRRRLARPTPQPPRRTPRAPRSSVRSRRRPRTTGCGSASSRRRRRSSGRSPRVRGSSAGGCSSSRSCGTRLGRGCAAAGRGQASAGSSAGTRTRSIWCGCRRSPRATVRRRRTTSRRCPTRTPTA